MNKQIQSESLYEKVIHGTKDFPYALHTTVLEKGFKLYPHLHEEFELLIMKEGNGIIHIDNKEYRLNQGEGILLHPREIHYGDKWIDDKVTFYAILFSERMIGSPYQDMIYDKYVEPIIHGRVRLPMIMGKNTGWKNRVLVIAEELEQIQLQIEEARGNNVINQIEKIEPVETGYELFIKSKLMEMWSILYQHKEEMDKNGVGNKDKHLDDIKLVIEFINDNYSSKITLKELSTLCHISEGHLSRIFQRAMKKSAMEYLMDIRIEKSCHMLLTTSLSIGEIALRCGFNDYSYYSMIFKKCKGITPRGYRGRK